MYKKNISTIALNDEEGIFVDQLNNLIAGYDHAPSIIYLLHRYKDALIDWPSKFKDYDIVILEPTYQFAFAKF